MHRRGKHQSIIVTSSRHQAAWLWARNGHWKRKNVSIICIKRRRRFWRNVCMASEKKRGALMLAIVCMLALRI